jgi:hypothetical protein
VPRSYAPGTPQRGTASYGYYEEVGEGQITENSIMAKFAEFLFYEVG